MGGHYEFRNLLQYWFPQHFSDQLPEEESNFDIIIVDGTQYLIGTTFLPNFSADYAADKMVKVANHFANHDNVKGSPTLNTSLVILMDNPSGVPKNKTPTQLVRDKATANPIEKIFNEEHYNELMNRLNLNRESDLLIDDGRFIPSDLLTKFSLWRSINLRWQLTSLVTKRMLLDVKMPQHKVMIIDDAVVMSPQVYATIRKKIVRDYHFTQRSDYDKEVLVSHVMTRDRQLNCRYILYNDGKFARLPLTGIGEADLKACNYINRENGMKRHLLVSQDTDMIFILLLHMKRLSNKENGRLDEGMALYIDSQTPSDKTRDAKSKNDGGGATAKENHSKSYRYVNIRGLYESLLELFAEEYPCVQNPIETMAMLANMLDTDFTAAYPTFLGLNNRSRLWDTFSELHHHHNKTSKGYLSMSPPVMKLLSPDRKPESRRRSTERCYPLSLYGILGGKDVIRVDPVTFVFSMDMMRVNRFIISMCQIPLIDDMSALKMHYKFNNTTSTNNAITSRPYYEDATVLACHAKEILSAVAEYRQEEELCSVVKGLTTTTKQPMVGLNKSFKPTLGSIGSAIKTSPIQRFDRNVIVRISRKDIPPNYGIPTQIELNARLARLIWLMNYLQSGGVSNTYATSHCKTISLESDISCYGWVKVPLKEWNNRMVYFNCAYFEQACRRANYESILSVFAVEETTRVQV